MVELITNDTFIECLVIPPDKLEQIRNKDSMDTQIGKGKEYQISDVEKDENDKVEERIQMWIMAGGDAEVAASFRKKRFLQKSLQDLFERDIPLPNGMSVHFINKELTRINNRYSRQFKDLLGVSNTSDVLKQGLANSKKKAVVLLGERPHQPAEFQYADDDHPVDDDLGPDFNLDDLYGDGLEVDEDAKTPHYLNTRNYRQIVSPVKLRRRRERQAQGGRGGISKKTNKLAPSFRSRRIWQPVF